MAAIDVSLAYTCRCAVAAESSAFARADAGAPRFWMSCWPWSILLAAASASGRIVRSRSACAFGAVLLMSVSRTPCDCKFQRSLDAVDFLNAERVALMWFFFFAKQSE